MNVLIIGANGQIGKQAVHMLQEEGLMTPIAAVRTEEQLKAFEAQGIKSRLIDLEASVDALAEAMSGCEAIVFTAGSGGQTGDDKTILVDLDGAVKTMEAAEQVGIERYVMISSMYANRRDKWTMLQPYLAAKHYADKMLEQSGLQYTIIRPGFLTNDEGTGQITVQEEIEIGSIPREDVAKIIVEVLQAKHLNRREFDVIAGETAIKDAIQQF